MKLTLVKFDLIGHQDLGSVLLYLSLPTHSTLFLDLDYLDLLHLIKLFNWFASLSHNPNHSVLRNLAAFALESVQKIRNLVLRLTV